MILLVLSGCSAVQRRQTETKIADALVSDEQENELGFQLHEQLKKDNVKFSRTSGWGSTSSSSPAS